VVFIASEIKYHTTEALAKLLNPLSLEGEGQGEGV
jgi:hypothetical protein